ncbi:MAG: hypothetical protein AAF907_09555, partial [Planctomycetota bacterium]
MSAESPASSVAAESPTPERRSRTGLWYAGLTLIGIALPSPFVAMFIIDGLADGDMTIRGMTMLGSTCAAGLAALCLLWFYSGWRWQGKLAATVATAAAGWLLLFLFPPRWDGAMRITGFDSRFAPTAEERVAEFIAQNPTNGESARILPEERLEAGPNDWPGLLGPNRDGTVLDAGIRTDWRERPPTVVWRHPVGPGWGGFSVVGDRCFTM